MVVVIILAAVVILTLSKNNPVESAKEARFKEDVRTFQDELALSVSKEYADAGGHRDTKISASDFDEIKRYIPSFSEKYRDKFVIENDELRYTGNLDEKEKEYAKSLNVKEKNLLPDEYQQVEYIESTGTQWIDTKTIPNENTCFIIDMKYERTNNDDDSGINQGGNKRFHIGIFNGYFHFGVKTKWKNVKVYDNQRHVFYLDSQGNIKIDNMEYKIVTTDGEIPSISFSLFRMNGIGGRYTYSKLYNSQIYKSQSLVRNFIPCYSKMLVVGENGKQCVSGTIGLYDTVEGKFYTNQGTGDFIPGADVD